jgi:Helix-turn-helix of DDE superfamily endonuclease
MLEYTGLRRDRRRFLALTGLTLKEFNSLLSAFVEAYQRRYASGRTLAGRKRTRRIGGGRRGKLVTAEQTLLFIVVYQKTYPLQIVMGELFGLSQSGTNQWIHGVVNLFALTHPLGRGIGSFTRYGCDAPKLTSV